MYNILCTKDKEQYLILFTSLNYQACAPKCLDRLLTYPGPLKWIKNGVKPAFTTPPLEIPRVQQQQAPAAGRVQGNEAVRGAGGRQVRERQRARGMAALEEEDENEEVARGGQVARKNRK